MRPRQEEEAERTVWQVSRGERRSRVGEGANAAAEALRRRDESSTDNPGRCPPGIRSVFVLPQVGRPKREKEIDEFDQSRNLTSFSSIHGRTVKSFLPQENVGGSHTPGRRLGGLEVCVVRGQAHLRHCERSGAGARGSRGLCVYGRGPPRAGQGLVLASSADRGRVECAVPCSAREAPQADDHGRGRGGVDRRHGDHPTLPPSHIIRLGIRDLSLVPPHWLVDVTIWIMLSICCLENGRNLDIGARAGPQVSFPCILLQGPFHKQVHINLPADPSPPPSVFRNVSRRSRSLCPS